MSGPRHAVGRFAAFAQAGELGLDSTEPKIALVGRLDSSTPAPRPQIRAPAAGVDSEPLGGPADRKD